MAKAQSQNINQYRPYLLVPNTNKSLGIFGLEQLKLNQMTFKVAMRHERQKHQLNMTSIYLTMLCSIFK